MDKLAHLDLPEFSVWIVGGGVDETAQLRKEVARRPGAEKLFQQARVILWGRVDTESLAELYSRSTIVAMPSRRETFGLVATQAMLCEAPIAASYVGGLKHTVIHKRTGAHFEPGDSEALAFIISALVRNSAIARWLGANAGRWARKAFAHDSAQGGLNRILDVQDGRPVRSHPIENGEAFFIDEDMQTVPQWLGTNGTVEPISSTHNSSFSFTCDNGSPSFVKLFTTRPDYDFSIYKVPPSLHRTDWRVRISRSIAASCSAEVIPIRDHLDRLARFEWATPAPAATCAAILDVAAAFSATFAAPPSYSVGACYAAYAKLANSRGWSHLAEYDIASARLNASLTGRQDVFVRNDPRVELIRLQLHAQAGIWPLEEQLLVSMRQVLAHAASLAPLSFSSAAIRHGSLTLAHVLTSEGRLKLCDLEEARFAFGDIDTAGFILDLARSQSPQNVSLRSLLPLLTERYPPGPDRNLVVLWFVVQAFHLALGRASWGAPTGVREAVALCQRLLNDYERD